MYILHVHANMHISTTVGTVLLYMQSFHAAGLSSQSGGSLEEREERGGMSLHVSVAVDTVHCERRERPQWRQHHAETDNEQTDRLNRQAIQGQWSSAHLLVQMK